MSRIVVTGGAGMIGSHLVARLLGEGHDVMVLDDLSSGDRANLPAGATFVLGSVADAAAVEQALTPSPDAVAHLAALFANQNSVEHPVLDLEVGGLGTLNVLEAARARSIGRVLVCSSSCVYGHVDVATEDEVRRPSETPYAITKALGEDYARFYAAHHGLHTVIVRPFNAYGPHERPGPYRNVIPNFLAAARRGEPLVITGSGEETRDFTFVTDTVDGMVRALFGPAEPGSVFNLGTGVDTSIADLAAKVNALTGNGAGMRSVPRRAWDGTLHRRASIDRARDVLGYAPATSLDDGLAITLAWLDKVL